MNGFQFLAVPRFKTIHAHVLPERLCLIDFRHTAKHVVETDALLLRTNPRFDRIQGISGSVMGKVLFGLSLARRSKRKKKLGRRVVGIKERCPAKPVKAQGERLFGHAATGA